MAKITNPLGKHFYMDNNLSKQLDDTKTRVMKDDDRVFIVDGRERVGKSVLAMQIAAKFDPTFNNSKVCFTPDKFIEAVQNAKQYSAIVFDEAFTGLSSRNSLSRVNNLLVSLMMEMGQRNLFIIIVMPSLFFLERYVVLFRATGLFHVYTHKGKRGRWIYFKKDRLKYLYLNGKKFFNYSGKGIPKSSFKGVFYEQYVVNEKLYREKKRGALDQKSLTAGDTTVSLLVRDRLLWCLYEQMDLSYLKMSEIIRGYGVGLAHNSISVAVKRAKRGKGLNK